MKSIPEGNITVSFSGGRTSAYMAYLFKKNYPDREFLFVFANTGKEREETLDFVDRCDREFGMNLVWVEADIANVMGEGTRHKIIDFNTASRNGQPFESMIRKYGIPNVQRGYCTRELKANAMDSYRKSIFNDKYWTAIGIRMDEFDRMSEKAAENRLFYPLVSMWPTTKADVNSFWSRMPFDLKLKPYEGNCDLCFKKSDRKLIQILQDDPSRADWWNEMELKYGGFVPESQVNRPERSTFYRGHRTAADLLKKAKGHGFQASLFSEYDSCGYGESCEVY